MGSGDPGTSAGATQASTARSAACSTASCVLHRQPDGHCILHERSACPGPAPLVSSNQRTQVRSRSFKIDLAWHPRAQHRRLSSIPMSLTPAKPAWVTTAAWLAYHLHGSSPASGERSSAGGKQARAVSVALGNAQGDTCLRRAAGVVTTRRLTQHSACAGLAGSHRAQSSAAAASWS